MERFKADHGRITSWRVIDTRTGSVVTGSRRLSETEARAIAANLNKHHGS